MLKPFKIIEEREAGKAGRYPIIEADLETPEGKRVSWSVISGKDIVVVLALDNEQNVYLKQEWRLNRKDFVWEVVSGVVEDENPTEEQILATAHREIQEEVGMKAGNMKKLLSFYPFNHMRSKIHLFLAQELAESKLATDEHEFLEVKKMPFREAYDLVVNKQEPTAQNALIFLLAEKEL